VRWSYAEQGKRLLDIIAASLALLLLSPVILLVAAAVALVLGRPVLFRQVRPGRAARPFTILKFRTMRDAFDASGRPLPDADRLTGFGRFLRSTSLDELPEFWNVLRGDMSLVGPRPLVARYLTRYSPEQARRLEVRPGITGLAQVRGRNAITWEERFDQDVTYVDSASLGLDLRILVETVFRVLARHGIHAEGHPTMTEFMGQQRPDAGERQTS